MRKTFSNIPEASVDPRDVKKANRERADDKWCEKCGWLIGNDPNFKCGCDCEDTWECPKCGKIETNAMGIAYHKARCKGKHGIYEKDPGKTWTAVDEPDEQAFIHLIDEAEVIHSLIVEKVVTNPDGSVSLIMRKCSDENMTNSEKFLHRFDRRNRELRQLLKDKGSDYSGDEDRHRNFKLVHFITCGKPIVITPLVSCLIRQLDTIQRAFNLLLSGKAHVKGETMKDTLRDNTGYSNIAEDTWEMEEKKDV